MQGTAPLWMGRRYLLYFIISQKKMQEVFNNLSIVEMWKRRQMRLSELDIIFFHTPAISALWNVYPHDRGIRSGRDGEKSAVPACI